MSLLPINPADFPDVPTRKALIAIDLQNDFLADDGALPVKQPDGMVDRILQLADAVRATGYGEIIWVRSQFDTSRPAGEQQIMAADAPQLPARPNAPAAARARRSPPAAVPLEADPDAFLSVVGGDQARKAKPKPQCVRKGTRGAEFLPAIATAKGPRDYAMTKSYYSAFQSGQLLNLLRRQFATELYICGSMSNVSVYATALAASSHGFDITVVEDCCGYRSEMRHMNAARRLTEQTGCEFRNAADVIPTLKPKTPPPGAARRHQPPRGPPQIPPELIAAAMAGSKGIPVRLKPAAPPSNPDRSTEEEGKKRSSDARKPGPVQPPPASPPDLPSALDGLKLSADSPDNTDVPEPATTTPAAKATTTALEPKDEPSQPEAGEEVQPVVIVHAKAGGAIAQGPMTESAAQNAAKESSQPAAVSEPHPGKPEPEGQKVLPAEALPRSGAHVKETNESVLAEHMSGATGTSESNVTGTESEFLVSEKLLMTPTPDLIPQEERDGNLKTKESSPPTRALVEPDAQRLKYTEQPPPTKTNPAAIEDPATATEKDPAIGGEPGPGAHTNTMAGDSKTRTVVSEPLCEGDTTLTENFLPASLVEGLFEKLCEEVHFKKMLHQGGEVPRFVAVQGAVEEDGTQPVYRHPSDESPPLEPFTPAVQKIREHTEKALGHPVNHALIQCYRDGNDYISEHSDKTLDIFRWSYIANVSIGAQRTMVFRTKRAEKKAERKPVSTTPDEPPLTDNEDVSSIRLEVPDKLAAPKQAAVAPPPKRQTIRCPMPHNSLIKMGLVTNEKWVHGIKTDKRPQHEKSPAELAWNGIRISLTFRYIDTFLSPPLPKTPASPTSPTSTADALPADADDEPLIWGQGATSKTRAGARTVVNGQTPEAVALIRAFGRENNSPEFDWEANYGRGYDVLHMKAAPRYFGCGDALVDGRVRLMLAECGVKYARGDIGHQAPRTTVPLVRGAAVGEVVPVRFEVDDAERTTVVGDFAILLYLDAKYPRRRAGGDAELARTYGRLYAAMALEQRWKRSWEGAAFDRPFQKRRVVVKQFKPSLQEFEAYAAEAASRGPAAGSLASIAGGAEASVADCALWPVLHDIAVAWTSLADESAGGWTVFGFLGLPALDAYYAAFARRRSVIQVFGEGAVEATTPFKPDLPTEEFGLSPVEQPRSPESRGKHQDGVGSGTRKNGANGPDTARDVATDADADGKKASLASEKGKLPMLTEFGSQEM